jgi:hypothetical protein
MKNFNFTIKDGPGKYSNLDKEYNSFLKIRLKDSGEDEFYRWETYNLIMDELLKIGEKSSFNEIKYRLTDGENPNKVIMNVLSKLDYDSNLIFLLKRRIKDFIEEDFYNRFC